MKYKVTLRANLEAGTLYWVSDVDADTEASALVAAEAIFLEVIDDGNGWAFTDYEIIPAADSVEN